MYKKCPSCRQKIRLPLKKGKHKVKCPKCQKTIELDWNMCDENCENCHHHDNHENLNVAENNDNNYKSDENCSQENNCYKNKNIDFVGIDKSKAYFSIFDYEVYTCSSAI